MLGGKFSRTRLLWIGPIVLVVLLSFAGYSAVRASRDAQPQDVAFSEFLRDVQSGKVRRVTVAPDALQFEHADGKNLRRWRPRDMSPRTRPSSPT